MRNVGQKPQGQISFLWRPEGSAIEIDMLYAVAMLTVALIVPDLGTSTCLIRI